METELQPMDAGRWGLEAHLRRVEQRKARLGRELESRLSGVPRIDLEIGCGHGHWLTDYASERVDTVCVGIDIIGDRIDRANRKAARAKRENLHFIKAEAFEFLDQLPQGVAIESVFILFPDPWPKKRHWKNRIVNPSFLELLASRCLDVARLHFRTDHSGYFDWAAERVESAPDWRRVSDAPWPFERETVFQSKAASYQSMILEKR